MSQVLSKAYFMGLTFWLVGSIFCWFINVESYDKKNRRRYARYVLLSPLWFILSLVFVGKTVILIFRDAFSQNESDVKQ